MRRLLIATKNAHKAGEIRAMLGSDWEVVDMLAYPDIPAPEETGKTFSENARIKAEEISRKFPGLVLSDDSGLVVDALGGDPGVDSALYAGTHGDSAANRAKLKTALLAQGSAQPWTARFCCVMVLAEGGRTIAEFGGHVEGRVIAEERGEGGFGYDSMFIPDGHERTFGELPASVKNGLSHRGRALAGVVEHLK